MLSLSSARAIRDGGIDAVAALNEALREALIDTPTEQQSDLKLSLGRVVATILEQTVELAVQQYPQLEPDAQTWIAVARARAAARSG